METQSQTQQEPVKMSSYETKLEKLTNRISENLTKQTEIIQERVELHVKNKSFINIINNKNKEINNLRKQLDKLTSEVKKTEKNIKLNATQFVKKSEELRDLDHNTIQLSISKTRLVEMNKCTTMVQQYEKESKIEHYRLVRKSSVESSKKFLSSITNTFPEELVRYIGTFIPYDVRIQLLESRVNFTKLAKHISTTTQHFNYGYELFYFRFLKKLCNSPEYFELMTPEEKFRYAKTIDNKFNKYYCPNWEVPKTKQNHVTMIQHAVWKFKKQNPAHAFKVMKIMSILIDPSKKYWFNVNHSQKVGNYSL
jgi:hypothetical protein